MVPRSKQRSSAMETVIPKVSKGAQKLRTVGNGKDVHIRGCSGQLIVMDNHKHKRWMECSRVSKDYLDGVESFLNSAFKSGSNDEKIPCPCKKCVRYYHRNHAEIYDHHVVNGIMHGYDALESITYATISNGVTINGEETSTGNGMVEMIREVFGVYDEVNLNSNTEPLSEANLKRFIESESIEHSLPDVEKFNKVMEDAEKELYPSCKDFTKLSFLLHLYLVKCLYGWCNSSFDVLLDILRRVYPNSEIPKSFNKAKKVIESLGLKYEKIDACPNDCLLFRKEYANDDSCSKCEASRWKNNENDQLNDILTSKKWKKKKVSMKIIRYFPLKWRLQRLFMSSKTATLMRWHARNRKKENNILRHPTDSEAWENLDQRYPEFAKECRNVRLGLASDGFNPFGTIRSVYRT
ncbi:uncharacterized protein [Elaeis guineensis]|uniref:uncharacterized protein n=1 Tax=Elaeis guineensis var. tenera TaxID=51953 RepID=UPI003C6D78B1